MILYYLRFLRRARPGDEVVAGAVCRGVVRLGVRAVRSGLCGGKAGRLPPPWGPYRRSMNPGSRGAVEVGGGVRVVVVDGGTQSVKSMLSTSAGPVGQLWACGVGRGRTGAGAGDEEVGTAGVILLSTSLCGWYRSGM